MRACLESVGSLCCQQALFMLMRRIPKSKIQGVHEQLCFLHHLLHLLLCSVVSKIARGCSGKMGFSNFCHLSLASTGLPLVVQKLASLATNGSNLLASWGRGGREVVKWKRKWKKWCRLRCPTHLAQYVHLSYISCWGAKILGHTVDIDEKLVFLIRIMYETIFHLIKIMLICNIPQTRGNKPSRASPVAVEASCNGLMYFTYIYSEKIDFKKSMQKRPQPQRQSVLMTLFKTLLITMQCKFCYWYTTFLSIYFIVI